jgi:hypothetical protein
VKKQSITIRKDSKMLQRRKEEQIPAAQLQGDQIADRQIKERKFEIALDIRVRLNCFKMCCMLEELIEVHLHLHGSALLKQVHVTFLAYYILSYLISLLNFIVSHCPVSLRTGTALTWSECVAPL